MRVFSKSFQNGGVSNLEPPSMAGMKVSRGELKENVTICLGEKRACLLLDILEFERPTFGPTPPFPHFLNFGFHLESLGLESPNKPFSTASLGLRFESAF